MNFDWWTFGLQAVNFLVLVWILHRFLYRPVLARIDARKEKISAALDEAEHKAQQADQLEQAATQQRREIERSRDAALSEAHAQAEKERAALVEQAHDEARKLRDEMRAGLDDEREQVIDHLQRRAAELAIDLSRRLLEEVDCASATDQMLARLRGELDALSDEQLTLIRRAVDETPHATVRSARALDDATKADWTTRIAQACQHEVDVDFVVDDTLIEGAQLELPGGAVLAYHWKNVLAQTLSTLRDEDAKP